MNETDAAQAGTVLYGKAPLDILRWAYQTFGDRVTIASSFGVEDVVLIDLATRVYPRPDVFFLDTDLLFHQTYQTMQDVTRRYPIAMRRIRAGLSLAQQAQQYGEALWERDPDQCCFLRKVSSLNRALDGYEAWITGMRREQSATRAHIGVVEWDEKRQLVKINPLALMTTGALWEWVRLNHVPYNPLHDQGFPSIGCMPCTRAVAAGEDARAGRWSGFSKKECGLHE
ncbi:MAG: phosphoadenylyl-sulfate reductase [Sulfobacillus acidophilus]|uniref:Adenosine 5'-phosphosulfate reductase n=1 Tax=Sulfobacillus acidophilus TaxID=53633 RepID=A0A2T2WJY5_9FIRM|nr:MAG: phosphoadenylyl-sulfate reductase [Sulfobacillus acidophilus]